MTETIAAEFSGQDVYVGIDTHKRNWSVCILGDDWERRPFSHDPRPDRLVEYLRRHVPGGHYHLAYEAGFAGNWIAREFARHGVDCMVVNAADIPTNDKDRRRKTDARDCRKIALALRAHTLGRLYLPEQQAEDDRKVLRTRLELIRKQTRTKNQIKSLVALSGIELPPRSELAHWSGPFIAWLEGLFVDRPSLKMSLDVYLEELRFQRASLARQLLQIRILSRSERFAANVALLVSVPGIGLLSAMVLLCELIDIHRFRDLDHLAGYIGLVPDTRSSGESTHTIGMTSRANNHLRVMLIESSWIAIRYDPALTEKFDDDAKRMPKSKAIVRTARKLLSRIHHVLREQEPYRIEVSTTSTDSTTSSISQS
jgi:transposase